MRKLLLVLLFTVISFLFTVQTVNAQTCAVPAQPGNVLVEYPGCSGDNCVLTQASCGWDAVTGATSYNITITEVDSGSVVKQETVTSNATYLFPVTQGKTYRCTVAAVNACGTGASNSHELLCQVEGLTGNVVCGQPCTSSSTCIAGTTCIPTSTGSSVCAIPGSNTACAAAPGVSTCCSVAPVVSNPPPPAAGTLEVTYVISALGVILLAGGGILLRSR